MTTVTATISSKGQITLPAAMRRSLGSRRVRLEMKKDGSISLSAEIDLGGALAKYAKGKPDLQRETEESWEQEMKERHVRWMRR
jgi:bifunctional DNA-binding transcriptional regulator/antitoxin component of YhaV-PrlF toxin-antitoxin module